MRKREPCSVDIWSYKVVQNPQKPELKRTSLTFFRVYITIVYLKFYLYIKNICCIFAVDLTS